MLKLFRNSCIFSLAHLRGHLSIQWGAPQVIAFQNLKKTSLIISTPNSQHATFPSPTAISSTFLLLLRTSSSNLERRTSGCHVFQHGYLGDLQKHMSSTKTGHHGFFSNPLPMLIKFNFTWPQKVESGSWIAKDSKKCMPSAIKDKGEMYAMLLIPKKKTDSFIHRFVEFFSCFLIPFYLIRPNPLKKYPPTKDVSCTQSPPQLRLAACLCLPGQRNGMKHIFLVSFSVGVGVSIHLYPKMLDDKTNTTERFDVNSYTVNNHA